MIVSVVAILVFFNTEATHKSAGSIEMIDNMEEWVVVTTEPDFSYKYDVMKAGVLQHLDREYTHIFDDMEGWENVVQLPNMISIMETTE